MIQSITTPENIDKCLEVLKSDGCFIVDNFIEGEELTLLRDEVQRLCDNSSEYEFGSLYRGNALTTYDHNNPIRKTFNRKWLSELNNAYGKGPYGKSVIATHDYKSTDNWARQGWLHSDKQTSFKYFLYLTDIDKTCGALHLCPGSIEIASKLNKKLNSTNQYESKRKIEETYPDLVDQYPPVAIEKPAGTLIVFDSDTWHKGGVVQEGKERLIIRLHSK